MLADVRERGGRLFFLGVGGSAGNCSHAVNDFRKLAGFEAYAPTDNVSELTARTNDEGWETVFVAWLKGSRLRKEDGVFVFSVGGGSLEKNISPNLVRALQYAKEHGRRHRRRRRARRRLHGQRRRRLRDRPDRQSRYRHAAQRRRSRRWSGTCWCRIRALKAAATKWESARDDGRAVFLDRDGVINRAIVRDGKPYPPAAADDSRSCRV